MLDVYRFNQVVVPDVIGKIHVYDELNQEAFSPQFSDLPSLTAAHAASQDSIVVMK